MSARDIGEQDRRHPALTVLLVALTALWLFSVSFRVLLSVPVTFLIAQNTVNEALSPLDHAQLVEVAEAGRAFVVGERGALLPEGDDPRTTFPPDVVSHMEDVRAVLQGTQVAVFALTVLLAVVLLVFARRAGRATMGAGLFFGGIAAVAAALLLVIVGGVSFDTLFAGMHRLLFADGTWTFAEDSLLICAYPLAFWVGMGVTWALVLVLFSALIATVGVLLGRIPER
jgi:integral membrane protein (TIGR01906 family)